VFSDGDWVESKDQDPDGDVRLIQLADVGDGEYRNKSRRFLTRLKATELCCTFLQAGDILVARMPEPLGRAGVFPGDSRPSITAVDVCIIRPRPGTVSTSWLLYAINSPQIREAISQYEMGTTRKRISRSNLARIAFPVPPLAEQMRIAAAVEALLARVNAARQRLAKVPAILKRFRQSVLAAACFGRLTTDWREQQSPVESGAKLLDRIATHHAEAGHGHGGKGLGLLPVFWSTQNGSPATLRIGY
jgi:type I restriction enzyme S subunit